MLLIRLFVLFSVLTSTALAQSGEVQILGKVVNEGSNAYITALFLDDKKELVVPESVWYQVYYDSTVTGQMFTCTSETVDSSCVQDTDCDSGDCDGTVPYECSDVYCDLRYFCRNDTSFCQRKCEAGGPSAGNACTSDTCTDNAACTGANCDCIGTPNSVMDLTLTPYANRFMSSSARGKENKRIVVWFTYPSGCSGTGCVYGSGEAQLETQNLPGICAVQTVTNMDGVVSTTCP